MEAPEIIRILGPLLVLCPFAVGSQSVRAAKTQEIKFDARLCSITRSAEFAIPFLFVRAVAAVLLFEYLLNRIGVRSRPKHLRDSQQPSARRLGKGHLHGFGIPGLLAPLYEALESTTNHAISKSLRLAPCLARQYIHFGTFDLPSPATPAKGVSPIHLTNRTLFGGRFSSYLLGSH